MIIFLDLGKYFSILRVGVDLEERLQFLQGIKVSFGLGFVVRFF